MVSCANWESGYFSPYRHLAARADLDAVLHLGDYIYEYASGSYPEAKYVVRPHEPRNEILTLADYRTRHGHYKTDADLQTLHATHPVIAIWDDHEFANDAWSGGAENHTPGTEGAWADRAAGAKQAYFEWMPVRASTEGTVYRRLRFGNLADLHLLDLRTFRSQQSTIGNGSVDDPDRTITGRAQLDWLKSGLAGSDATWKLVGTSVMISPVAFGSVPAHLLEPLAGLLGLPKEGLAVNVDQWDGYTDDRKELIMHLRDRSITNTVFLTGDIHMAWANDVPVKAATYPLSASAATEFVVTSVTSDNLDDILHVAPQTVSAARRGGGQGRQPPCEVGGHGLARLRRPRCDRRALADGLLRGLRQDEAGRDRGLDAFVPDAQRHPEGRAGGPPGALNVHFQPCQAVLTAHYIATAGGAFPCPNGDTPPAGVTRDVTSASQTPERTEIFLPVSPVCPTIDWA